MRVRVKEKERMRRDGKGWEEREKRFGQGEGDALTLRGNVTGPATQSDPATYAGSGLFGPRDQYDVIDLE